jgi:hypothetical protein
MKDTNDQKLLADLVKRAETGEHIKFEFIRDWKMYQSRRISYKATKMLVRSLKYSTKSLFKEYCKAVPNESADATKLLVRNVLLKTTKFYERECDILLDMIDEYETYLLYNFNIIFACLGEIRPISELRDYRGI